MMSRERAADITAILTALDAGDCEDIFTAAHRVIAEGERATQRRMYVAKILIVGPGDEPARIVRAARAARPEPVPYSFQRRVHRERF